MDFGTAGRLLVFLDSDRRDPAWALLAHLGSTRRQSASASGIGSLAATLGRWSGAGCESGGQELESLRAPIGMSTPPKASAHIRSDHFPGSSVDCRPWTGFANRTLARQPFVNPTILANRVTTPTATIVNPSVTRQLSRSDCSSSPANRLIVFMRSLGSSSRRTTATGVAVSSLQRINGDLAITRTVAACSRISGKNGSIE